MNSFSPDPPRVVRPTRVDDLIDSRLMARLQRLDVVSRKIFSGRIQGERRSRRRGISVEFADFRPYVHGDDLRFVDWNIYGRLDRLFMKIFLEEEDLSLVVAVDTSASMDWGTPNKFEYARRLAMALGYIGLSNQNRVSMCAFGEEGGVQHLNNLRGRRRTRELGQWLLDLQPGGGGRFEEAMKNLALSRLGRGVVVVLSDFMFKEGYQDGLRMLAGRGFDLFAAQVLSPEELDPASRGMSGDLRLVDLEDEAETEVTVSEQLLRTYKDTLNRYCGELREYCIRRDVTHMLVDTSTDLDVMLVEYFRRRGLLR
ncbi:MAG: DUF58 domain-containing protein [Planctomycetota bacterium]|nr:DUF58 domain-containing protein [Planctomycetota bacterium]MEC8734515.1 DUF58 domain-containing protein [Planctomycetota bacterium]MED6306811.1 DUF58 domain-containing protein [Planctomycetota bacterium]